MPSGVGSTFNVLRGLQWAVAAGRPRHLDVARVRLPRPGQAVGRRGLADRARDRGRARGLPRQHADVRRGHGVRPRAGGPRAGQRRGGRCRQREPARPRTPISRSPRRCRPRSEGVLSVAALGPGPRAAWAIAPFSNTFPQLSAPGVAITSAALGGGLRVMSGTSMASPACRRRRRAVVGVRPRARPACARDERPREDACDGAHGGLRAV